MKVLAKNKRALFDYEITEKVEAGILLSGQEAKSARLGNMDLKGSYVSFASGKPILKQATIAPYKYASHISDYDPGRDRELLLHKNQIARFTGFADEKGVSVLPLEVHGGRTVKILIGVGKGRKKVDKRQRIKERDIDRRLRRGEDV